MVVNRISSDCGLHRQSTSFFPKGFMIKAILSVITILTLVPQTIYAQSSQICSCSPPTYHWILDFTKGCPLGVSTNSGGIRDVFCDYNVGPDHNGDFTPIIITEFTFIDLDLQLSGIKQITALNLVDDAIITYQSATTLGELTGGVQGTFVGLNAAGQTFTLEFLVRFSNTCEILPFDVGDSLGFLVFVSTLTIVNANKN